jgi:hypothetical protein
MSSQGNSVKILNNLPDNMLLVPPPKEYWILNLYFFVFVQKIPDGNPFLKEGTFLLIECPRYSYANSNKPKSFFWASPYLAIKLDTKVEEKTTVKEVIDLYKEELESNKDKIELLHEHYLNNLRVSECCIKGKNYVEYKKSFRDTNVWKCYYIQEYYINNDINEKSLRNLLDPEGVHHFRYYRIESSYSMKRKNILFEGKPLSSNITRFIINNYKNKNYLIDVDINKLKLVLSYSGYILKFDICGSTKALREIEDTHQSFTRNGLQYGHDFLVGLGFIMESELRNAGIFQYHIEGDGFLATAPIKNKIDVNKIIKLIKKITTEIDIFTRKINIVNNNFSYRAVLMKGNYNYGKNYGLFSNKLSYMGQAFVTVARMEQCLKDEIKKLVHDQKRRMNFGVSEDVYKENEKCFSKPIASRDKYRDTYVKMVILSDTIEEGKK